MSFESPLTTYRGATLEELLPQIREELGPEAVIVRQREGIVGGIGGFFGKKCVEIEARAAVSLPSLPPRAVVNAYDTGEPAGTLPLQDEREAHSPLVDTLMAQTSPFVEQLAEAMTRRPDATALELFDQPAAVEPEPEPVVERPSFLKEIAARKVERPAGFAGISVAATAAAAAAADDAPAVRTALEAAGIPVSLVDDIVAEVEQALRPFAPTTSFRDLARSALARRIDVAYGWRSKRRTIAILGLAGSGRTLTTAKLCHAYARAGRSVTALSLEAPREALRLSELTMEAGVGLEIATSADELALAKKRMRKSEIVVVDTPAIADPVDGRRLAPLVRSLEVVKPDETHLLIPASADLTAARAFVGSLTRHVKPSRILITHADARPHTGVAVGISLAERVPISFIGDGDRSAGRIAVAEADVLARMVLA